MGVVKVVFSEALYREDIDKDPTYKIGAIKEHRREAGTFAREELAALFPAEGLGPWQGKRDFACFLLAAETGIRRGEILVLRWGSIDFDAAQIHVTDAWKGGDVISSPK